MNSKRRADVEREVEAPSDENGNFTIYSNPNLDFLFGLMGGEPIPTKQDAFKPISVMQVAEDGTQTPIKDFYIKNEESNTIKAFTTRIKDIASDIFTEGKKIGKPNLVEVIISISTLQKRFGEVDVDNLAKCVLDGLNGIAFDDDSQVSVLMVQKFIHEMKLNSILIGITKLSSDRRGTLGDFALFSSANNF